MPTQSNPAEFRAKATACYRRLRAWLIAFIVVAGGAGLIVGAMIGRAVGSSKTDLEASTGGFGLAGGLIGLVAGTVLATAVAGIIWVAASLIYVMTQDGA